jgi:hypothetical protein
MTKKQYRNKPDISIFWDSIDENQLAIFVMGHPAIESVLVQLIEKSPENQSNFDAYSLNFPQKVDLCQAFGLIDDGIARTVPLLSMRPRD